MLSTLSRRLLLVWGLLAASLIPTLVQFYAMFTLDPGDFGLLVLIYIPLSLGNASVYSLVCEPWSSVGAPVDEKPDYDTVLLALSVITGVVTLGIGAALGATFVGVLMGLAIICSMLRLGSRYASVIRGRRRFISPPDSIGLAVLVVGLGVTTTLGPSLTTIAAAWCSSALVATALSEPLSFSAPLGAVRRWLSSYWEKSRVLLTDAALTEAGTVGIPLLLAPMMGVAEFGVFRAAASVTAPVRMVLNPLRPYLAKQPLARLASVRVTLITLALSTIAGGGVWLVLLLVQTRDLLGGSVVAELSSHSVSVGLFVLLYSVSVFSYYVLRMHVGGRSLMRYRAAQLVAQCAGPVTGFFVGGVAGAIIGRALAFGIGLVQSTAATRLQVQETER